MAGDNGLNRRWRHRLRKIVHIDMDAFYASVEQRDDPSLRGRPVVVAWRGSRSVVCAASYEARRFGIRSAMPALRAERLCPDAVFVAPDFPRYRAASQQIREVFHRHTDLVEPLSLDEAYLDVTENKTGLPSATEVALTVRAQIRAITGLSASAGIAPNKFLAKIASDWRKPDGQHVIRPTDVEAFLLPLPVSIIPGVGKVMSRRLEALGVHSVADLRKLGEAALTAQFGRWGGRLFEYSHGIDERPVQTDHPTRSISSEDTFVEDLTLDEMAPAIERLAEKTWLAASREHERVGRTVVLKLKSTDFQIFTRSQTPATPPARQADLQRIALALRDRVERPANSRYRLVGVGLSGFVERDDLPTQEGLRFKESEKP